MKNRAFHTGGRLPLLSSVLFCIAIFLFAARFSANAQSITPTVLNAAGGTSTIGGNFYDWSVGEMTLINTDISSTLIVTQGFLQPDSLPPVKTEQIFVKQNIAVHPNPANNILSIDLTSSEPGTLMYQLNDASGKMLVKQERQKVSGSTSELLDVSRFGSGVYFLSVWCVRENKEEEKALFKIEKL